MESLCADELNYLKAMLRSRRLTLRIEAVPRMDVSAQNVEKYCDEIDDIDAIINKLNHMLLNIKQRSSK